MGFGTVLTQLHTKWGTGLSPIGGLVRGSNLESVELVRVGA
jgi:hypothetical protein